MVAGASARSRRWGFGLWIASNAYLISWTVNAAAWGDVRRLLDHQRGWALEQLGRR